MNTVQDSMQFGPATFFRYRTDIFNSSGRKLNNEPFSDWFTDDTEALNMAGIHMAEMGYKVLRVALADRRISIHIQG